MISDTLLSDSEDEADHRPSFGQSMPSFTVGMKRPHSAIETTANPPETSNLPSAFLKTKDPVGSEMSEKARNMMVI